MLGGGDRWASRPCDAHFMIADAEVCDGVMSRKSSTSRTRADGNLRGVRKPACHTSGLDRTPFLNILSLDWCIVSAMYMDVANSYASQSFTACKDHKSAFIWRYA